MTLRLVSVPLLLVCLMALPAVAQESPTVGLVVQPGCTTMIDIRGQGGELYSVKADGFSYSDWQADAGVKGGPLVGMVPADIASGSYQVLDNWNRIATSAHVVFVYVTFPGGGLYVDSGPTGGYNFVGNGLVQQVGDSNAALPGNAGVVLPGNSSGWFADLGSGPVAFPQSTTGGVRLAFAPIAEMNGMDLGGCGLGAASPDPATGEGLIIGYNVYRVVDVGVTPTPAELGMPGNWVAYLPLAYGADTSNTLVTLHDPDMIPHSGDEVMEMHDAPVNGDGSPRLDGTPPDPSGTIGYWYAVQPVVAGNVSDWAAIDLGNWPTADYSADLDGDGTLDAVDIDPLAGNGPEFQSPQAVNGHPGLGLTNGGLPLLSAPMYGIPLSCPVQDPNDLEIDTLSVSRVGCCDVQLDWPDKSADLGPSASYQIASDLVSNMWANRAADAGCVSTGMTSTSWPDTRPVTDDAWYYLVRAAEPCTSPLVDSWGRDSTGVPRPSCP